MAMAEHSMCQPGRPGPISVSQKASPGLGAFQRAKSRASSLSKRSESTRAPSSMSREILVRELAVFGELGDAVVVAAVVGAVGDVFLRESVDERRPSRACARWRGR